MNKRLNQILRDTKKRREVWDAIVRGMEFGEKHYSTPLDVAISILTEIELSGFHIVRTRKPKEVSL